MINKFLRYLKSLRNIQLINLSLARGGATSALRSLDYTDPLSWEFTGFSQNGEDGIIDVLSRRIINPNRYFIEIGAADGLENNTAWLAVARRFNGIWIEGSQTASEQCAHLFTPLNYGLEITCMFITKSNVLELGRKVLNTNPDVFSLDIDGNDYHVAEAILSIGLRPKIFIVEYNSAFGPEMSVTIPYREDFKLTRAYGENLYYGCSISAWKKLFLKNRYSFVTVDSNGVNAIFIDSQEFDANFVEGIRGIDFTENFSQSREYRTPWNGQFAFISEKNLVQVD